MICPHCQSDVVDDARFCGACGKAASHTESLNAAPAYLQADVYAAMIGKEIAGRYRVSKKLGEGGMGAVFRAEQISLKRSVAVKLLRPGLAANQQMLRRFNAEAEAVAKLSHPNTVNIYDFGQDTDGTLFIAMEFVEGESLRDVLAKHAPLPIGRALAIASQIAASLTDAHMHSIVHRDLKPDNVMLSERGKHKDVVRVLDFGIAKLRDDSRAGQNAMTQAGDMLGTPQYMAPEQIKGDPVDGRADVYALGCILFEMVTGRMCFEAPTIMGMLSKHLVDDVDAPSKRRPDLAISPAFDELVLAALQKEATARPATMEAFGEQIAALFASLPPDQQKTGATGVMALPTGGMAATPTPTPTPSPFSPPTPPPSGLAPTGYAGAPPGVVLPPYNPIPGATPAPITPVTPPVALAEPGQSSYVNPPGAIGVPPTTLPPDFVMPKPAPSKDGSNRTMFIMIGGVVLILIIIALAMKSFGVGKPPGKLKFDDDRFDKYDRDDNYEKYNKDDPDDKPDVDDPDTDKETPAEMLERLKRLQHKDDE